MRNGMLGLALGAALALAGCSDRPMVRDLPAGVEAGSTVTFTFSRPVTGLAVDQYWVVIAPMGSPAEYIEGRIHVPRDTTYMKVDAPRQPGQYELRLHGDWPRLEHHIVQTVPIVIRAPAISML